MVGKSLLSSSSFGLYPNPASITICAFLVFIDCLTFSKIFLATSTPLSAAYSAVPSIRTVESPEDLTFYCVVCTLCHEGLSFLGYIKKLVLGNISYFTGVPASSNFRRSLKMLCRVSLNLSIGTRICFSVSRSRTVTSLFSKDS